MSKIGVKKIGFVKKGRLSDSFFDRTSQSSKSVLRVFTDINFVQNTALLVDETVDDEKGVYHKITLDFTTRQDLDDNREIIESYIGKPVILLVNSVDGHYYIIGSNDEPAYLTYRDSYNKLDDRNIQTSCSYINLDGLFEPDLVSDVAQVGTVIVNRNVVIVPWQGAKGNIFVESNQDWKVEVIK